MAKKATSKTPKHELPQPVDPAPRGQFHNEAVPTSFPDPGARSAAPAEEAPKPARRRKSRGTVTLPFGNVVAADPYLEIKYEHQENWWLNLDPDDVVRDKAGNITDRPGLRRIHQLLKSPKPGYHYAWPAVLGEGEVGVRNRQNFFMRKSANIYEPVHKSELQPHHGAPIMTHEGTDDDGVYWYSHQLVGIPPQAWETHYRGPSLRGLHDLAGRQEQYLGEVEEQSQGLVSGTMDKYLTN